MVLANTRKRKRCIASKGQFKLFQKILKPRLLLMAALFILWETSTSNGITVTAMSKKSSRSHLALQHKELAKLLYSQGPRMSPSALEDPEGQGSDEIILEGGIIGGIGNGEMVRSAGMRRRKKQDCGVLTVAARSFMEPSLMKRSYFANTHNEVQEKQQTEESSRTKREAIYKRNEVGNDGPLPWTCETKYEWEDKGADHYPRFVRTAECKSRFCFNGFFRCKPRRYKTKVLKRLTGTETASCEEDDVSLPDSLRSQWKFVTVTINLCCDCTSRIPGTDV